MPAGNYFDRFRKRLYRELGEFVRTQLLVGFIVAALILLWQIHLGVITKPAVRANVISVIAPYLVILALFGLFHLGRTAYLLDCDAQSRITDLENQVVKNETESPKLDLTIETALWVYDLFENLTIFFLSAYLINKGAPTVAKSWKADYRLGEHTEEMTALYLIDSYKIAMKDGELSLTNDNLLVPQVLTKRLEKGDGKLGRLLFTLPGNRLEEIGEHKWDIRIECFDFQETRCVTYFQPTGIPLIGTRIYPGEQLRRKEKPDDPSPPSNLSDGGSG
jgi:hypothetical protein